MHKLKFILFALLLCSCGREPVKASVLTLSAISDRYTTDLRSRYEPIAQYLSKKLAIDVHYQHLQGYTALVQAFKNGDVQLAWCGGLTGVQARHGLPGARAIAQGIDDPKFMSYFIANAKTGILPSSDFPMEMAGHKFSFGPRSSTSGRLMPSYFISKHSGKSPAEFFGLNNLLFSQSHDMTCEWVQSGQAEVGVVNYQVYEDRVKSGKTDPAKLPVIWKTPLYADYHWTAHPLLEKSFGPGFIDKLQKVIIEMKDKALLKGMLRNGFIKAANKDFADIKKIAESLKMLGS